MPTNYSAKYRDEFGEETITILNDGKTLSLTLRGEEFKGSDFHSFTISNNANFSKHQLFHLSSNGLCGYSITCDIPVLLVCNEGTKMISLNVHAEYGKPDEANRILHEVLQLEIEYQGNIYKSSGKNQYNTFDEQLTELKKYLPDGFYLKTCWNCAFSDYLPIGSGGFGNLGCFRNTKNEYHNINDGKALFLLWKNRADDVQEVYVCSEFEKRQAGIGGLYVG